jgi:putative transport protein
VEKLEAALTGDRAYVERLKRGDKVIEHPDPSFILEAGDLVVIGARQRGLVHAATRVGPEIDAPDLMAFPVREAAVVVTSSNIAGHTIASLDKRYGRGAFLIRITRGQEDLPMLPRTIILHAVGALDKIARAAKTAGFIDPDPGRFALPFLAAGIVAGTLIGLLQIRVGPVPIGLGTSCAILVMGLVTGWARSRYPLFGGIPEPATRLLQDVGLTVFIAVVGLTAGPHAVAVLEERGLPFFLTIAGAGAVVTLAPQLIGYWFGRYVLHMPIAILLGGLAGAQTATPALNALKDASGSNVFVLGYAIPYAINNVLLTLWGTVIVIVVHSWSS